MSGNDRQMEYVLDRLTPDELWVLAHAAEARARHAQFLEEEHGRGFGSAEANLLAERCRGRLRDRDEMSMTAGWMKSALVRTGLHVRQELQVFNDAIDAESDPQRKALLQRFMETVCRDIAAQLDGNVIP
jgi:hypothetical protein